MVDIIDRTQKDEEVFEELQAAEIRRRAQAIPKGSPGDCKLCGYRSGRLVAGVCAPCRDFYNLP
jgi:predicted Zn-ribbon and HTH transcriptional regulator